MAVAASCTLRTAPLRAARAIRSSTTSVAAAFAPSSPSPSSSSSSQHFRRRAFSRSVRAMASSSSDWAKEDSRRMLHAVYRVGDMDDSIAYYRDTLGMKLLRFRDIKEEKYSNAFLGYGPEDKNFALELTYNYGVESYDLGTGFGHFALASRDVAGVVAKVKAAGRKVSRDAGPVKGGKTVIAFVDDPTGYKWELIERPAVGESGEKAKEITEPIAQVMLRVTDLEKSIKYYTECLGMRLLRTRENPEYKYTLAFLAYGPEEESTVFELTYNWGKTEYENFKGTGYAQVAISTRDVYKTAEQIRAAGGAITREPGPVPGIGTKICATTDPDGWKVVFVDEADFLEELK